MATEMSKITCFPREIDILKCFVRRQEKCSHGMVSSLGDGAVGDEHQVPWDHVLPCFRPFLRGAEIGKVLDLELVPQ